ncbi:hypothetical protein AB205_0207270 [Aquarana catesbeiana]|uniref:Uncharacterized protein n=1 Tax=Aquarana catesbeiana TaxID=8400 RepID=A0A2G9RCU3_AQUCT|nr:hypothetical protein AB205_0207270 [Aquarana catesbeiana]
MPWTFAQHLNQKIGSSCCFSKKYYRTAVFYVWVITKKNDFSFLRSGAFFRPCRKTSQLLETRLNLEKIMCWVFFKLMFLPANQLCHEKKKSRPATGVLIS